MLKRQGGGGQSREDVLKKMAAAFDKYEELFAHLQVSCATMPSLIGETGLFDNIDSAVSFILPCLHC